MPWHVARSSKCPAGKPFAVIKNATGTVVACHETSEKATKQMRALYAKEKR